MYQLIQFITRNRGFILFVFLEILSLWCVYKYNNYANAVYFNTSNYYVGKTVAAANAVREYLNLREVNADLAAENARLNQQIAFMQNQQLGGGISYKADSVVAARFKVLTVAKVINNSTNFRNNTITIDKGYLDGLRPGMGVISSTGVVGKVQSCSPHLSILTSVLHSEVMVSSKIKRTNDIGTAKWEGINPDLIELLDIPRNKSIQKGDTIVTSHLNSVFGPGVLVGIVRRVGVNPDQAYHDIDLQIATDFRNLSYVYVIENTLRAEQEKLESSDVPKAK
jgi:rod shape-determining protein MreC